MHYFRFYRDEQIYIDAVTNFQFFASLPTGFDDVLEGVVNIPSDEYKPRADEMMAQARTRRAVFSVFRSESNDIVMQTPYMWSVYANYFKGFCVEYNDKILDGLANLKDVENRYATEDVYVDVEYGHEPIAVPTIGETSTLLDTLGHKTSQKEQENETRLIFRYPPTMAERPKRSNGELVPIQGREKAFCAIYLGAQASDELCALLKDFAQNYHIPCYKMKLSLEKI